jgi:hypothetical protein
MKHYYSQNVIDLVNDYSFVGLNLTCLMIYLEILKNVARSLLKLCNEPLFFCFFWTHFYS